MSFSANLYARARERAENQGPVRVGLIGAGKFGSMFLAQVPTSPEITVTAIADRVPDRAVSACKDVGWCENRIAAVNISQSGLELASRDDVDVVVEATGHPAVGVAHARAAIVEGKHVVMVNVEADVLAGPLLVREAATQGVTVSMAYGDQPALVCEMVDWARACGFTVVAAGKGSKYMPGYERSTPDTVWHHYGLTAQEADAAGMNRQMFNSFLDGTKSAIEMAAIANATGLGVPQNGLNFPPCGTGALAEVLGPLNNGAPLVEKGIVEVVSSHKTNGQELPDHLRWGVYVVFEAPNNYTRACFQQYGLQTDKTGRYCALWRPYHFIGLELNISILSAAIRGEPTGMTNAFNGDVAAVAKRDLRRGDELDGEGGYTVWGKLIPAERSITEDALPIGLAHGVTLNRDIVEDQIVRWSDVSLHDADDGVKARREMIDLVQA